MSSTQWAAEPMPDDRDDDRVLVARAQHDPAQFDALFERYWDPVFRYCYYRLGNWHRAEDAAGQVFLNAFGALTGWRDPGYDNAFRAWLFTIAFRVVANQHRSTSRHAEEPIDAIGHPLATDRSPEEVAMSLDDHRLVHDLVGRLKPDQRQLVELRLAGLTDIEIAQVLDKSPSAIRKAQSRAVYAMRDLLEKQTKHSGEVRHG